MEVLLGPPSFSIEVQPSMAFVRAQTVFDNPTQETQKNTGSGFELSGSGSSLDEVSSGSSSSIGVPDDDSEDDGGEQIQSKLKGGLCSLDSLEDSLPIKRGLSTHFTGKSKSFANLSEVIQVEDLKKQENPFNKRRRILMASKWSRSKSSFYNWPNPKSMPLLALNEDDDDEEDDDNNENTARARVRVRVRARDPSCSDDKVQESDEDEDEDGMRRRAPKLNDRDRKLYSFKSRSCFDLQEYEYDQVNP